jgi:hypothetical protein
MAKDKKQTKAVFLKRLDAALAKVNQEISGNAKGSKFASGLANEGYAGGYAAALRDVQAMMTHGYPADTRHYWS